MYPALSSVHTNTFNFVHILIQAFFVRRFSSSCIFYLFFAFSAHATLSLHLKWLKQRKLTLSRIDLSPISINRSFLRALQKGGRGLPSIGSSISQYEYGLPCESQEGGYRCSSKGFALRVVCLSLMGGWTGQSYGHRRAHLSSTLSLLHPLNIKMYLSKLQNIFVQI